MLFDLYGTLLMFGDLKAAWADWLDAFYAVVGSRGLTVPKAMFAERENADRHFPDAEAMIRWIDQPSLVPFLVHVGGAEKEGFRREVIERMIKATQRADGRCFETFRRINLFARK